MRCLNRKRASYLAFAFIFILVSLISTFISNSKENIGTDNYSKYNPRASVGLVEGKGYKMRDKDIEEQEKKEDSKKEADKEKKEDKEIINESVKDIELDSNSELGKLVAEVSESSNVVIDKEADSSINSSDKNDNNDGDNNNSDNVDSSQNAESSEPEIIYDKKTPVKRRPSFETDLQNGLRVNGLRAVFWAEAKDYKSNLLGAFNLEVYANGNRVVSKEETYSKRVYYADLHHGENTITISVRDNRGYRITKVYKVFGDANIRPEPIGYVYVTVDARTVGKGVLVPRRKVPIYVGQETVDVITTALTESGYTYTFKGQSNDGFYLSGIGRSGLGTNVSIPTPIMEKLDEIGTYTGEVINSDYLVEKAYSRNSGWIYHINGIHQDKGMSASIIKPNDEIFIGYTLEFGYEFNGVWFNGNW